VCCPPIKLRITGMGSAVLRSPIFFGRSPRDRLSILATASVAFSEQGIHVTGWTGAAQCQRRSPRGFFLRRWSSGRAPVSKTGEWGSIPHRRATPVSSSGRTARCQRADPGSNPGAGSTFITSFFFLRAWPIFRGTGLLSRRSGFDSRSTVQCPRHLTDRIRDYESRHGGSNPPEGATLFCGHLLRSSNG
jgi:hypothetical protein